MGLSGFKPPERVITGRALKNVDRIMQKKSLNNGFWGGARTLEYSFNPPPISNIMMNTSIKGTNENEVAVLNAAHMKLTQKMPLGSIHKDPEIARRELVKARNQALL